MTSAIVVLALSLLVGGAVSAGWILYARERVRWSRADRQVYDLGNTVDAREQELEQAHSQLASARDSLGRLLDEMRENRCGDPAAALDRVLSGLPTAPKSDAGGGTLSDGGGASEGPIDGPLR